MGRYQLDTDISWMEGYLSGLENQIQDKMKLAAMVIAGELQENTESVLREHDEKKPKHGVHLSEDVKKRIKTSSKGTIITVNGGSKTGKLWWLVDEGHIAQNGTFVPGIHFTDKAYRQTEVDEIIDNLLERL